MVAASVRRLRRAIAEGLISTTTTRKSLTKPEYEKLQKYQGARLAKQPTIPSEARVPSQLHLFDLPLEIIDMIFKLAYGNRDAEERVLTKGSRFSRQIKQFMVSKAYFATAAAAFVRNTPVLIEDKATVPAIVNAYATQIIITDVAFLEKWTKGSFPVTRELNVKITDYCFQGWCPSPWAQKLSKSDMERDLLALKCIKVLRGLNSFRVDSSRVRAEFGKTAGRDQVIGTCRKNAKIFEEVISKSARRPRPQIIGGDCEGVILGELPLYYGSKVSFEPEAVDI